MSVLVILERAHRGRVEQQYAHALWLVEGLTQQHPTDVLMRGAAAGYAVDAPAAPPLRLGGAVLEHTPDYSAAIGRLAAAGARVLVSGSSLAALGLAGRKLLPSVELVNDAELGHICAGYDRLWYL
ncbi:MAG TPA: hypothetical protein VGB75_16125 [Jatrophihabitans sp.]|uniref:hypothetical protein n=1 Tax=Jatrophihabitans sp. TaxID=1932789 RepID=UPI002EEC5BA1